MGILDREVALYRALRPHLRRVTFVTYGDSRDLSYGDHLDSIRVVCNSWRLPGRLYRNLMPRVYPLLWRGPIIAKSNQVPGSEVALKAAHLAGKRFLARCGYLYSEFIARQNGENSVKARYAQDLERRVFRAADHVQVTTSAMQESVVERYGVAKEKISVIPNYVDTELFQPEVGVSRNPRRICFVGRFHPQKNPLALLDAIEGLDVELEMVGDGPLADEVRQKVSDRGLPVRFLGNVPHRALPSILNGAGLFVLPSHYEGHPKAVLEAMACGLPTIGTDVPGIREIIRHGETGYLCGTSAQELRDAIKHVTTDSDLRARMGLKAREYVVERFALDRIVDMELGLLEKMAAY